MTPNERRTKGTGGLYQRPDGYWVATIELPPKPDGSRNRKQIVRKKRADVVKAQREARLAMRDGLDITARPPTVAEYLTRWLDEVARPNVAPKTLEGYRTAVHNHIIPELGNIRVTALTPDDVRRMGRTIQNKGLSSTTARHTHMTLRSALRVALEDGKITRNPATVKPPAKAITAKHSLTNAEAGVLLRSVDGEEVVRWSLALFAGLRRGEALGLTRQHVDLDLGVLRIVWQLQAIPAGLEMPAGREFRHLKGRLVLKRPKSQSGIREVPIAAPLFAILERHLANMPPDPWALVCTRNGGPRDPDWDSKAWAAALKAAGLPAMRLHDARHSTATILHGLGVSDRVIQEVLGHADVRTTEGYAHTASSESIEAMRLLGSAIDMEES